MCMCIYIYICMFRCVCIYIHTEISGDIYIYIYIYIYISIYMYIDLHGLIRFLSGCKECRMHHLATSIPETQLNNLLPSQLYLKTLGEYCPKDTCYFMFGFRVSRHSCEAPPPGHFSECSRGLWNSGTCPPLGGLLMVVIWVRSKVTKGVITLNQIRVLVTLPSFNSPRTSKYGDWML